MSDSVPFSQTAPGQELANSRVAAQRLQNPQLVGPRALSMTQWCRHSAWESEASPTAGLLIIGRLLGRRPTPGTVPTGLGSGSHTPMVDAEHAEPVNYARPQREKRVNAPQISLLDNRSRIR